MGQKKNRIILVRKEQKLPKTQFRSLLNGVLVQERDLNIETTADLKTVTNTIPTEQEISDMLFANKIVKNSKSNAIVLAKGKQLLASGVGQTSRVDALKQAIEKAKAFGFDTKAMRRIISLRKMDVDKTIELEYLTETYKEALGMLE